MGKYDPAGGTLIERVARLVMQSVVRRVRGGRYVTVSDAEGDVTVDVDVLSLMTAVTRPNVEPFGSFAVLEELSDHLRCGRIGHTGEVVGEDVLVAKPFMLRRSPFDGKTLQFNTGTFSWSYNNNWARVATNVNTGVENFEVMTPNYLLAGSEQPGEIIIAARMPVWQQHVPGEFTDMENLIGWVDLNTSGRFWATHPAGSLGNL